MNVTMRPQNIKPLALDKVPQRYLLQSEFPQARLIKYFRFQHFYGGWLLYELHGHGVEHELLKYRFIHLKKRLVLLVSRKTRPLAGGS